MSDRKWIVTAMACTILMYMFSISGPFVYDDIFQIVTNAKLHDITNLHDVFFCGIRQSRLILNLIYAFCWWLTPRQTEAFHAVNILLHLANAYLLWRFLGLIESTFLKKGTLWVRLTVTLFLLHPLQIQSVTYVMGTVTLAQCFFYLLCLCLHAEARVSRWSISLLIALSAFAKETCILIPVVLFLYDLTFQGKSWRALFSSKYLAYGIGSLAILPNSLILGLDSHQGVTGFNLYPFWEYLLTQMRSNWLYARLLIDSSMQSLIHEVPAFDGWTMILGTIGGVTYVSLTVLAWLYRKRYPLFAFGWLFWALTLLPTNTFFQMVNPFAEYRLYQANISVFIAIALLLTTATRYLRPRLFTVVLSSLALFMGFSLYQQQRVWSSEISLLVHSLGVYPQSVALTKMMGAAYDNYGKYDLAEEYYLKAEVMATHDTRLSAKDFFPPAALLFIMYSKTNQVDKAIIRFEELRAMKVDLPIEAYRYYLSALRLKKDRTRFERARLEAKTKFPYLVVENWDHSE